MGIFTSRGFNDRCSREWVSSIRDESAMLGKHMVIMLLSRYDAEALSMYVSRNYICYNLTLLFNRNSTHLAVVVPSLSVPQRDVPNLIRVSEVST